MSILRLFLFALLGMVTCLPSLLTWQIFNLWLNDLGHSATFIASLSFIGTPNYFKTFFIPYLEKYQPPILHKNRWINWMISSCLFSAIFASILGQYLPSLSYGALAITAMGLIISGIILEKSAYCFKLLCLESQERADAIWSHKLGMRVGSSFGMISGLFLAHYYNWALVYFLFSLIFLIATAFFILLSWESAPEPQNHSATSLQSLSNYWDLAYTHSAFLTLCFVINAGDCIASWFLTLYMRTLGMSYVEIAIIGKFWGLSCFLVGAVIGRLLWRDKRALFLWAMLSCFLHGISLLPLGHPELFKQYIFPIFLFKNITLGLKNVLVTAVISEYLAATQRPLGLFFLSSLSRSLMILVISLAGPIVSRSPQVIFWLSGGLALPGLWALRSLRSQQQQLALDSDVPQTTPLSV